MATAQALTVWIVPEGVGKSPCPKNLEAAMPAGDKEYPVREGWLKKQSGGQNAAGGRSRRRSIGEFVKKWDERYFVLTMNRLCYFKTQQVQSYERGSSQVCWHKIKRKTYVSKHEHAQCCRGSRTAKLPLGLF